MSKHLEEIQKYDAGADAAIVENMAKTYRLVLSKRDSAYVSTSDPEELKTVRENFLKKKLGLSDSDDKLDAIIAEVATEMKADRMKERLTFYYLCAKKAGKLSVFS
ncbi:uncharacterized protein DUF2853 [Maritalea mobilis]|uniref:Uncharacterized protein DUF2853 n=1 Tax=Maritalea mobilis TaxID=483324 RepID=A0A4R6VRW8_9HYPH|nr:DUF2853 family protein [Maritalea mobilis]TDQ66769.1 uncharacterized protein DUF2853 [Maritalea mobilis]